MKFVLLSQYYPPEIGAVPVRLSAMAAALLSAGHEVEVVTGMPNYPNGRIFDGYRGRLFATERQGAITIHRCWLYAAMGTGFHRMANYTSFMISALAGLLHASRPDVLFIESPPLSLAIPGLLAARARGSCITILNVADLWPDMVVELGIMREGLAVNAARRLEAWAYRHSTFVNAVTDGIHRDLIERKNIPAEKVSLLPNGVDVTLMKPKPPNPHLRQIHQVPIEHSVVVYAGTLGFMHGLDIVLNAAALTRHQVTFLLVGDGSERARLETAAKERGLSNVRFISPRPVGEIADYYSIATAGLVCVKNFAMADGTRPSKTATIMGCGKPVLYAGAGEGGRLVQAAGCGIVTPPDDAEALAQAVTKLVQEPTLASAMGARGRAYVEANLGWDTLVQRWLIDLERRLSERHYSWPSAAAPDRASLDG